ncbi:hypothetical protein, partial [Stenotrophomonas sp. ZAC14D1_NAIMI4_6]|uniref:hypothetical protein n=1 Tax=Stenotrophomonas sp. ZAC14D1_NAIMI4_6 TaxID=2072410 RepID=UPI001C1FA063
MSRIQRCRCQSHFSLKKGSDPIVSTKVETYQQHTESVRGGAVWVCMTAGAMDGAYEPPWMGSR